MSGGPAADGDIMSRHSLAGERHASEKRGPTISDVAERAGVSKTTVSRYLSGRSDILAAATWKLIQETIADFHYKPSQIARSLKGGRTRLFGMVVADVTNPYSVAVLRGAEDECRRSGYVLALCNSNGSQELEQALLASLRAYQIEGLILNSAGGPAEALSNALPEGLPIVLLDRALRSRQFDFVGLANPAAAGEATRHLIAQGFTEIAFLTEPMDGVSVRLERAQGFREAIEQGTGCAGVVVETDFSQPDAMPQALSRFMTTASPRRKAVIAASGLVTLRVIQAIQMLGLVMPRDLGLVGFDELEWSSLVSPGITTIAQPTYDIGVAAVRNLVARVEGAEVEPQRTIFSGTLIERGSSRLGSV
jgi:LacI family kdg operon repressor